MNDRNPAARHYGGGDFGAPQARFDDNPYPATGYAAAGAAAPAAVAPPAPAPAADDGVVVLSRAYSAHGQEVRRIRLRRPLAADIAKCGNPIRPVIAADGTLADLEVKWGVVVAYIPLLSDPPLPPSTVAQFEYFDLDAVAGVLSRFFVRMA